MKNEKNIIDEYLEQIWYLKEKNDDSQIALITAMGDEFDASTLEELIYEDLIYKSDDNHIMFTDKGDVRARQIIRAHRIAERLIHDVLGSDFEPGACEFEHIVSPDLVDSICILLGHPRECPHGMPIPEGQCCINAVKTAQSLVVPLTELETGHSARIAYINCNGNNGNQGMSKMDALQIKPGTLIYLHQKKPAYVIKCEGSDIAMDQRLASSIHLWKECVQICPSRNNWNKGGGRRCRKKVLGFMKRRRAISA
ncbi:DtxR family transcriptional regulator, Mn-dependent transcriptional regulator [Candidatus Magnetomoraceae bacterium gMMP-15]